MKRILFIVLALFAVQVAAFGQTVNITFTWDASDSAATAPASNPVKYRMCTSATAPPYATLPADRTIAETGTALEKMIPLGRGTVYAFATAYWCATVVDGVCQGTEIAESGPSNILKVDISIPPGNPKNYKVKTTSIAETTNGQTMQMAKTGR